MHSWYIARPPIVQLRGVGLDQGVGCAFYRHLLSYRHLMKYVNLNPSNGKSLTLWAVEGESVHFIQNLSLFGRRTESQALNFRFFPFTIDKESLMTSTPPLNDLLKINTVWVGLDKNQDEIGFWDGWNYGVRFPSWNFTKNSKVLPGLWPDHSFRLSHLGGWENEGVW